MSLKLPRLALHIGVRYALERRSTKGDGIWYPSRDIHIHVAYSLTDSATKKKTVYSLVIPTKGVPLWFLHNTVLPIILN